MTVLIGENGSGKSNVIEGIAFAAAAAADKLDPEVLYPRGIRVTDDTWMLSAFPENASGAKKKRWMEFKIKGGAGDESFHCRVVPSRRKEDNSFLRWRVSSLVGKAEIDKALLNEEFIKEILPKLEKFKKQFQAELEKQNPGKGTFNVELQEVEKVLKPIFANIELQKRKRLSEMAGKLFLSDFLVYAPENSTLRSPPAEGAVQPLGTKGEGLFRLLKSFADEKFRDRLTELQNRLHLFGWFDSLVLPDEQATSQARIQIHDHWLAPEKAVFDQRSANEGFLYVLFYFALLLSWRTPKFFAIDNIDTALNPRLCTILMEQVVELARKYDKQVICASDCRRGEFNGLTRGSPSAV